jgi:hypothetical protein
MNDLKMYIMIGCVSIVVGFIMLILMIFKKYRTKIYIKFSDLKKKMLWNGIIRSLFISYFEVVLTVGV